MLIGNLKITIDIGKVIIESTTGSPAIFSPTVIKNTVVQELMRAAADSKELEDIEKRKASLIKVNNNGDKKNI